MRRRQLSIRRATRTLTLVRKIGQATAAAHSLLRHPPQELIASALKQLQGLCLTRPSFSAPAQTRACSRCPASNLGRHGRFNSASIRRLVIIAPIRKQMRGSRGDGRACRFSEGCCSRENSASCLRLGIHFLMLSDNRAMCVPHCGRVGLYLVPFNSLSPLRSIYAAIARARSESRSCDSD